MNKQAYVFLLALLLASAQAFALPVGFKTGGNAFSAQPLRGDFFLSCTGNSPAPAFQHVYCQGEYLLPTGHDFFVGPVNPVASQVVLHVRHSDGSGDVQKRGAYDGNLGESRNTFNLWTNTLTQKGLLGDSDNFFDYKLLANDKRLLEQGSFVVNVSVNPQLTCNSANYTESDPSICQSPQMLCDSYFSDQNYCK